MAGKNCDDTFGEYMLSCSICYEALKNPRVLPCLHSFCQDCIERHHEIYALCSGGKLSCPTCRAIIPLPLNGVGGFRSDAVVERTRQILKSLPRITWKDVGVYNSDPDEDCHEDMEVGSADYDEDNDDTSDDETPSRKREYTKPGEARGLLSEAAGGTVTPRQMVQDIPDPPEAVTKRALIRKEQNSFQSAIANTRNKMLQLYHIENHVKSRMQNDVATQVQKLEKPGKKAIKKIHTQVEDAHRPILALLLKEQDKLYQKIVEVKSIHDVVEEVLDRTTVPQILEVHQFLTDLQKSVSSIIQEEQRADRDHLLSGLPLPTDLINVVKTEMSEPGKMHVLPTLRDPKKLGVQLQFKLTGLGREPGKFDFPTHATFHPNGDLIVSDKNNFRLQVFGKKGELKDVLFRETIKPRRARINPVNGNLYVSDEQSETVKVYSKSGQLLARIGEGYFLCPAGMDFDSKGNLIMTDAEKNYVSIHDSSTGKLLHKFFFRYIDDKKVPNPYYLAVNEDDQFIVTDSRNNRVKVFASNGQLLFRINKLDCPRGVCVDPYGNILIAEGDKHRIAMYSPYGKFLQYLIDREEHGLCYPLSLDMDGRGRLAVTQCGYMSAHEVLVFQIC